MKSSAPRMRMTYLLPLAAIIIAIPGCGADNEQPVQQSPTSSSASVTSAKALLPRLESVNYQCSHRDSSACLDLLTTKRNLAIDVINSDATPAQKAQAQRVMNTVSSYVGQCSEDGGSVECFRLSSDTFLLFSGLVTNIKYS